MLKLFETNIFGKLIIVLTGLYGIHIYGQIILFESRGILPSAFVANWILLFLVFILNNTTRQIIGQSIFYWHKFVIIIFLGYYVFSSIFHGDNSIRTNFIILETIIIPGFMLGIVSNLNYNQLVPFQRFVKALNSDVNAKRIYYISAFLVFFFFYYQAYLFYVNKLELTLALNTVNNEFYQDFGDYFIVFYCGWLSLRENNRSRVNEKNGSYILFTFLMLLEMIFAVVFLQLIGSNKAPLTIVLIGLSYILFSISSEKRLKKKQLSVLLLFILLIPIVVFLFEDPELLNNLRFFREASVDGIAGNSSLTSRLDQFLTIGFDQINRNWFFGDLTIENYIHSSLITIQTHLGIIGSFLFWIFVLLNSYFIYFKSNDRVAKSITIPILLVSIISSAFWWLPLWFLIGFIYMRKTASLNYGFKKLSYYDK
jgi:hypothetical protein